MFLIAHNENEIRLLMQKKGKREKLNTKLNTKLNN